MSTEAIRLVRGDITDFEADAVVNAANSELLPGGGVCGAIHAAAGPELAAECLDLMAGRPGLETGEAVITGAGALKTRHVIHAVGPVWHGGTQGEAGKLAATYRASLALADSQGLATVAFPSISTGIFGYPAEQAAPVAVRAVRDGLAAARNVREVTFVLHDADTFAAYERALEQLDES